MTRAKPFKPDPKLDLVLERVVDVPPSIVWECWTTPRHIKKWFTPAPWKTIECEIDLRPGGEFYFVMESPEGQKFPNTGCFLEIVKNERLVWTNALLPGYRPASSGAASAGRSDLHRRHHADATREGHEVHRARHSPQRKRPRQARRDGLPRRLGQGARPARGAGEEAMKLHGWTSNASTTTKPVEVEASIVSVCGPLVNPSALKMVRWYPSIGTDLCS